MDEKTVKCIVEAIDLHKTVVQYIEGLAAGLRRAVDQGPPPELREAFPEEMAVFASEAREVAEALEHLGAALMTRVVAAVVMGHAQAHAHEEKEEITFTSRHRAQA